MNIINKAIAMEKLKIEGVISTPKYTNPRKVIKSNRKTKELKQEAKVVKKRTVVNNKRKSSGLVRNTRKTLEMKAKVKRPSITANTLVNKVKTVSRLYLFRTYSKLFQRILIAMIHKRKRVFYSKVFYDYKLFKHSYLSLKNRVESRLITKTFYCMKNQKLLSRKARMKQYTFTLTNKKKKVMDKKQESLVYEEIPKTIEIPKPYHFTPLKYDSDNKYKEEWFDDKDDNKDYLIDLRIDEFQKEKAKRYPNKKNL